MIFAVVTIGIYIGGMFVFYNPFKRRIVTTGIYDEVIMDETGIKTLVGSTVKECVGVDYRQWIYHGHHPQYNTWIKYVDIVYWPLNWLAIKTAA